MAFLQFTSSCVNRLLAEESNFRFISGFSFRQDNGAQALQMRDCLVVSVLDCQTRGRGLKSPPGQKDVSRFLSQLRPSTVWRPISRQAKGLAIHPHMPRLRKVKSLTLYNHGSLSGLTEGRPLLGFISSSYWNLPLCLQRWASIKLSILSWIDEH